MTDLGWKADGIERAIACGGVPLEVYRRPGFGAGKGVRRADGYVALHGSGFDYDSYDSEQPLCSTRRSSLDLLRPRLRAMRPAL